MIGREDKADLLSAVPLFSTCSKRELRRIAEIADEISVREGKVLMRQGAPGREMFILLEGTVSVERDGTQVNALGPGDFIGEGALVERKPRNATITATSPGRALVITDSNFRRLLRDDEDVSTKVLDVLAERTPPDE
jgi:CRP/FNR family cyclic AMP-dependent transcriptional regulator